MTLCNTTIFDNSLEKWKEQGSIVDCFNITLGKRIVGKLYAIFVGFNVFYSKDFLTPLSKYFFPTPS